MTLIGLENWEIWEFGYNLVKSLYRIILCKWRCMRIIAIPKLWMLNFSEFSWICWQIQRTITEKTSSNWSKIKSWKFGFVVSALVVGFDEQYNNLQLSGGLILVEVPLGLSSKSSGQYFCANEHSIIKNFTIKIAKNLEKFMLGSNIFVTCLKEQDVMNFVTELTSFIWILHLLYAYHSLDLIWYPVPSKKKFMNF